MDFKSREIESTPNYILLEHKGVTNISPHDPIKRPFIAFEVRMQVENTRLELCHSPKLSKLSAMLSHSNAFAGINGGFWANDKKPLDWLVLNQTEIMPLSDYKRPCIYFYPNNIKIGNPDKQQVQGSILQVGPQLLNNGIINYNYKDYIEKSYEFDSDITADRHPRSIFAISKNYYHFIAVNGRSKLSAGLYLEECAELTRDIGSIDAINMDGGASSTLIINRNRINSPRFRFRFKRFEFTGSVPGGERNISTAILAFAK